MVDTGQQQDWESTRPGAPTYRHLHDHDERSIPEYARTEDRHSVEGCHLAGDVHDLLLWSNLYAGKVKEEAYPYRTVDAGGLDKKCEYGLCFRLSIGTFKMRWIDNLCRLKIDFKLEDVLEKEGAWLTMSCIQSGSWPTHLMPAI